MIARLEEVSEDARLEEAERRKRKMAQTGRRRNR